MNPHLTEGHAGDAKYHEFSHADRAGRELFAASTKHDVQELLAARGKPVGEAIRQELYVERGAAVEE